MAEDSIKRLYVQNVNDWKKKLSAGKFSDRELGVKIVKRAIILPARGIKVEVGYGGYSGGVCDNNFNFVAGYSRFNPLKGKKSWIDVDSAYEVDREDIVQLDEDVIFGGILNGHFGHFLMENWCRLWYVLQHPELKSKIFFVPTSHGGYKPWFDEFFRLMGIDLERIVYVKKPTQCRYVIIPDQAQYCWDGFTKNWLLPFQTIKSRVQPGNIKKLYLTRTKFKHKARHFYNEEYFEDFFSAHGFKVVAPEKLSAEEQISLVMGADEIAATLGTLTHFAMFCKPTAKFIMFPRLTNDETPFQHIINKIFGNYYIVEVAKNFMYSDYGNCECLIGSTKYWKEFVADYFGEDISEDDDSSHLGASLDKYIDGWCRKYVGKDSANFDIVAGSLRDMCNRIIALEHEKINRRPSLIYQTHVAIDSWSAWKSENQISNLTQKKYDIQAVKIKFSQPFHDVFYSVYYGDGAGWSQEISNGDMAGTVGQRKAIFGIKIRLDEAGANEFDILYRVHTFDGAWTPWAQNGAEILSGGVKLNALQINLISK